MDKWKIIVIVALLAGLSGYGFYQQSASQAPPPTPAGEPAPPETPINPKLVAMKGKTPPAWDIPANLWVNTKAPMPLASLKGSPVLMEFWRIGCSHCEQAAPFMNEIHKQLGPKGLKMVTIHTPGEDKPENPETDWQAVREKIKEWKITYPVAQDEGGKLFRETYGGERYPAVMLLDREGKVQYVSTAPESPQQKQDLIENIEKLLKSK